MAYPAIFEPLRFRNLTVKNRIFRSNVSGRFDNYDGSGNQARINWETKFAKGGVGAIISSFVPVHLRGRIVPNYAMIDNDSRIPFWRAVGEAVHRYDCKFILQLSHGGRQRDINGIEYPKGLSSTNKSDPLHGFECERMTIAQINETVAQFAEGARRAREAGLDGVELHGANGYLITQFLSSAINDRKDEYGGTLENRARFVREIVRAIRARVGRDFHLQMKISAQEFDDALAPFGRGPSGNTLAESIQVCKWLVEDGVDSLHVSTGSFFPHPRNPAGVGPAGRGPGAQLRHDDLERRAHVRQLPAVPRHVRHPRPPRLEQGRRPARRDRGQEPAGCARDQGRGHRAGDLHGRLPDRLGHHQGAHRAATATRSASRGRSSPTTISSRCSAAARTAPTSRAPTATAAW